MEFGCSILSKARPAVASGDRKGNSVIGNVCPRVPFGGHGAEYRTVEKGTAGRREECPSLAWLWGQIQAAKQLSDFSWSAASWEPSCPFCHVRMIKLCQENWVKRNG